LNAVIAFAELSLKQTLSILNSNNAMEAKSQNPVLRVTRNVLNPPVHIDGQHYYYGILDNAARVARCVDITTQIDKDLKSSLYNRLLDILMRSKIPEYRSKAVSLSSYHMQYLLIWVQCEVLLANSTTRTRNHSHLLEYLDQSKWSFTEAHRTQIENVHNGCCGQDSYYANKIWGPIQRSLIFTQTAQFETRPIASPSSKAVIEREKLDQPRLTQGVSNVPRRISHNSVSSDVSSELRMDLSASRRTSEVVDDNPWISQSNPPLSHSLKNNIPEDDNEIIPEDRSEQQSHTISDPPSETQRASSTAHSTTAAAESSTMEEFDGSYSITRYTFPLNYSSRSTKQRSYLSSAISPRGDYILFRGDRYISVFKTPNEENGDEWRKPTLNLKSSDKQLIKGAALCEPVVAVLTTNPPSCYIHKMGSNSSNSAEDVKNGICEIGEENFYPTCVATISKYDGLYIALGWRGLFFQPNKGKITILYYNLVDKMVKRKPKIIFTHDLRDSPKNLSFSPDGNLLSCSTMRYNIVQVWNLTGPPDIPNPILECDTHRPFSQVRLLDASHSHFCSYTHAYLTLI
jgi:hypothetical protein